MVKDVLKQFLWLSIYSHLVEDMIEIPKVCWTQIFAYMDSFKKPVYTIKMAILMGIDNIPPKLWGSSLSVKPIRGLQCGCDPNDKDPYVVVSVGAEPISFANTITFLSWLLNPVYPVSDVSWFLIH